MIWPQDATQPALQLNLEQLSLSYRREPLWTIDAASWQQGELIWLEGRNGSGKTSLMKVVAGLLPATQGRVSVRHIGAANQPSLSSARAASLCCYLHQQPYVFSSSVRRNLQLVLASRYLADLSPAQQQQRLESALAWAGLTAQADQSARTLSGGEKQRLALARARLIQPRFWLLDEPTANLDRPAVQQLAALVEDLLQSGCGVLLTAHQPSPVTELAQHTWQLAQGRLWTEARTAASF